MENYVNQVWSGRSNRKWQGTSRVTNKIQKRNKKFTPKLLPPQSEECSLNRTQVWGFKIAANWEKFPEVSSCEWMQDGTRLVYNVVLVSGVQQSDSVIHAFFFLRFFFIQVITKCWVVFPVLHSRSLLVIYIIYSNAHVFILSCWFITPLPPPSPYFPFGNHKFVLMSISLLL